MTQEWRTVRGKVSSFTPDPSPSLNRSSVVTVYRLYPESGVDRPVCQACEQDVQDMCDMCLDGKQTYAFGSLYVCWDSGRRDTTTEERRDSRSDPPLTSSVLTGLDLFGSSQGRLRVVPFLSNVVAASDSKASSTRGSDK